MDQASPTSLNELDLANGSDTDEMATASLLDVLASCNRFLTEKELWAMCRECCLTLEYVHDSHDLFQSLSLSPETVAFDPEGNVCFLDLDIEPESMYVAPEFVEHGQQSYKSHLFSLGMTLLFATEYNTSSTDPRAALSDTFTDLLTTMTHTEVEGRPGLETVIEACDKALAEESSQEICTKIVQTRCYQSRESKDNIQDNATDTNNFEGKLSSPARNSDRTNEDFNDRSVIKTTINNETKTNNENVSFILQDTGLAEDEIGLEDQRNVVEAMRSKKHKGILLTDLLQMLDRCLDETELWSICRECVLSLQTKRKHFPAYISLDTIIIQDSGTVYFTAIPEDKPLEVVYMAPELQQKGILNDKTCLYGLGIALRSAAGFKNSYFLSVPDGEALEILITSFTHEKPEQRPDLNTAFEMCEEYEKVSKTSSQQVCLHLYKETLKLSGFLNKADSEKMAQVSFNNTGTSIHGVGNTANTEDNDDEMLNDNKQKKKMPTVTTGTQLAFKSLEVLVHNETESRSYSAFKNVDVKPKPVKDMNRVPSAFSSPATHFKPIVIQNGVTESTVFDQSSSFLRTVANEPPAVAARNSTHPLVEENIPESFNVNLATSKKSGTEYMNMKHTSDGKAVKDTTDLGETFHLLQSQGHLPSTDVLASVLAHYLTDCLTESGSKQGHLTTGRPLEHLNSVSTTSSDTDSGAHMSAGASNYLVQPYLQRNYSPQQNIYQDPKVLQENNRINTLATASESMPTQQVSQLFSENMSRYRGTEVRTSNSFNSSQNPSSNIHIAGAPLPQRPNIYPFPLSTSGVLNHGSHYSVPFSGLSPSNMPIQYTLVQDPATGLMQMLPVSYPALSHVHASQGNLGVHNYHPDMSVNSIPSSRDQLNSDDQRTNNGLYRFNQNPNSNNVAHKPSLWHQEHQSNDISHRVGQLRTAEKLSNGHSHIPTFSRKNHHQNEDDNYFQTSLSSKDAGTSLILQPGYVSSSSDMLTDRLQSSTTTDRQRTFSTVVHIIHETFGEYDFSDAGADIAIAEYIMSLSSLTWDTFRNAITEKYFHFVWSYEVLSILFETIVGHQPPELRNIAELPQEKVNQPYYRSSGKDDIKHKKYEIDSDHFNRQNRYQLINHQQKINNTQRLTNQFQLQGYEQEQLFNQHQHDKQPFSNRNQHERYKKQGSNFQKLDSQEKQNLYNLHEQDTKEQKLFSNQTHHVQAVAASTASMSHPQKSQNSVSDRPRYEIRKQKYFWSEASDSTDSEAMNRKQHFKKRYELDNTKRSLSLHNLSQSGLSSTTYNHVEIKGDPGYTTKSACTMSHSNPVPLSKDYYKTKSSNFSASNTSEPLKIYPDSITKDAQNKSDSHQLEKIRVNASKSNHQQSVTNPSSVHPVAMIAEKIDGYSSPPVSIVSHSSSKSDGSQEHKQYNLTTNDYPTHNETKPASRYTSHYAQKISNSNQLTASVVPLPTHFTHSIPDLPLQLSKDSTSHSQSSMIQNSTAGNSCNKLSTNSHINPPESLLINNTKHAHQTPSRNSRFNSESISAARKSMSLDNTKLHGQKRHFPASSSTVPNAQAIVGHFESDNNLSVEMRKLANEKPELYNDRSSSGLSVGQEKGKKLTNPASISDSQKPHTLQTESTSNNNRHWFNVHNLNTHDDLNNSSSDTKTGCENFNKSKTLMKSESSMPDLRPQIKHFGDNNRTNYHTGRSCSAVYSRQSNQPQTGVVVLDSVGTDNTSVACRRKGSDGSVQLSEIDSVLLPYVKRSSIVYHSAMIQLSLTAEVGVFINSIDEENRPVIEKCLASISQEVAMERRQRMKTQKLYKKLNEQTISGKKGDHNVSEQMLRDMTDMTKKLSFLFLCQTHLQMLLAELHGLDTSLLCSLSVNDGSSTLNLQPVTRNPYLQFRNINTPEAEQMAVLQAGTPRGLMSYLYTSSALSIGYVHQFLLCFRYIMTADQLLTFILEKFYSAQRNNQKDGNMVCIQHRSIDFLHFWMEGYYSVDFALNKGLLKKFSDFLTEQTNTNVDGADNLFRLYAACRLGENAELMHMTDMEEDNIDDETYFLYHNNPKRWDSFRSLLKRSKSDKSNKGFRGGSGKSKSGFKTPSTGHDKPSLQFSVAECSAHILAEQLTLIEQELYKKCHPLHFLNSQFQGIGVSLSVPVLRTPSMSRKSEAIQSPKRGLFVGEPTIESYVVRMINHSHELAHWVSAEILSCGSNKTQTTVITKFLTAAHLCHHVRNYATALSILDGLENLVVRQLPVWKNVSAKVLTYMDELTNVKMKLKSEALWLMSEKDCHIYPTIPCALFVALHIQQVEIGSFTLANGMYKWDKMRSISEIVDQLRIFRDHEYGFQHDTEIQRSLRRCFSEYSEQDLHTVASTQDNNFRRHPSSTSLSGTLKKVKNILKKRT